nr:hypothetical protein [Tanacetum cinerariifolium]
MIVELLKEDINRRYQDSPLMMVVKEIVSRLLEEEEVSHFGKEQETDKEEERFEEMKMVVKYESWVIK